MEDLPIKNLDSGRTIRASISFPISQYNEIEKIAQLNRVSLAWVVREAVYSYLNSASSNPIPSLQKKD